MGCVLLLWATPTLGIVKTAMLGVRNPKQGTKGSPNTDDDGLAKCAEVWFDELSLSGLMNRVAMRLGAYGC